MGLKSPVSGRKFCLNLFILKKADLPQFKVPKTELYSRTLLLTAIRKTLLLRSMIVVSVQEIGNRKHYFFKVFNMQFITRSLFAILLCLFCGATFSQPVDNPHNEALAAVRAGNLAKLQRLIDQHGANMNARNRPGESLLMMAIKARHTDIALYLLEKGANVQVANTSKVTPLMAAAYNNDFRIARLLIEKKADIHAVDQLKKTAIVYAAGIGGSETVELLLANGVDVNARYANDLTALMWAAGSGHAKTVELLLSKGADPALQDNRGKTALEMADDAGHLDVKKILSALQKK